MYQYFNHPVPLRFVFFGIMIVYGTFGCSKDEAPVEEVGSDAGTKAPTFDMGKAIPLPMPITDVFKYVPDAPTGVRARPGDLSESLLKIPTVKKVDKFKRLFRETLKSGPFYQVQYVLSKDGKRVKRVIATFHRQYARKDRHEAIVEMINVRLGKPALVKTDQATTHRWSLPEFGLEVRKDLKSSKFFSARPLDLVYDISTKYQPTAP
jgi:hypothetical protein